MRQVATMPNERFMRHHYGPSGYVAPTEQRRLELLHAAAPELLEAVKDALAFLDRPNITTDEWYKVAPDNVRKFRQAIAKAEGKA